MEKIPRSHACSINTFLPCPNINFPAISCCPSFCSLLCLTKLDINSSVRYNDSGRFGLDACSTRGAPAGRGDRCGKSPVAPKVLLQLSAHALADSTAAKLQDPAFASDARYDDDNESSYSSAAATSTASLNSSILNFREMHGRTYQNFKDDDYW